MENLYSKLMFEPLYNLYEKVARLLKLCLHQYLFSDEIKSHPGGFAEKRKRLSSISLPPLKASNAILAHNEEK